MKVTLNKKVFALDEKDLIKQFRVDWSVPTNDDIALGANAVMRAKGLFLEKVIAVTEIELTKNRFAPTYWVTVVAKGFSATGGYWMAEIGFDYVQAVMNAGGFDDKIDNFTQLFRKV